MKVEVHVPVEQYGFVLLEGESGLEDAGTFSRRQYDKIKDAFSSNPPLSDSEMTDFVYKMIHHEKLEIETYEKMSPTQKVFINQIKKAQARK